MNDSYIAGVDIGGSHITVALVNIEKRIVVENTKKRSLIDTQADAASIIKAWAKTIVESAGVAAIAPRKLAIAMPGPFDYQRGISLMQGQNKFDSLYGLSVKEMLAAELGLLPDKLSFTNDAACFLQGELFSGAALCKTPALGLTLGTGFGSARAAGALAEDADLWRAPFKEGIAEDYLSGRWLVQRYFELCGKRVADVKAILEDGGDSAGCKSVFEEFGSNLGMFLNPFIKREGVKSIVLGGSIAQSFSLFQPALQQQLDTNGVAPAVYKSKLGENAAMLGAAGYCLQQEAMPGKAV